VERRRSGPRAEGAGAKRAVLSEWAAGIGKGVGHGEKENGLGQAFSWVGLGFELGFLFWVLGFFSFSFLNSNQTKLDEFKLNFEFHNLKHTSKK
jgi:hypothetical protein